MECNRAIDLLEFVALRRYLSELLEVEVDLVLKQAPRPRIKKRVLAEVSQV